MEHYKLDILKEALPYIQRFNNKVFVIKLSGKIVADLSTMKSLAKEVALLHQVGFFPIIVHGGGKQMNELAAKLGIEQTIYGGRRVTDEKTLELAKMVFGGLINTNIASTLRGAGAKVVGLSGVDGNLISAVRRNKVPQKCLETGKDIMVDFGFVGDIDKVDTSLLKNLIKEGYVPVISSLGADSAGEVYNINADTVAAKVAISLGAEKLIYLTDVNGIYKDIKDKDSKINRLTVKEAEHLIETKEVFGGMVPKVASIINLLRNGVESAHIVGAFEENALLKEIFTDHGVGTMVSKGDLS